LLADLTLSDNGQDKMDQGKNSSPKERNVRDIETQTMETYPPVFQQQGRISPLKRAMLGVEDPKQGRGSSKRPTRSSNLEQSSPERSSPDTRKRATSPVSFGSLSSYNPSSTESSDSELNEFDADWKDIDEEDIDWSDVEAKAVEPVHKHLSFQPDEKLYAAAKAAKIDTPDSFWSHKFYRGPKGETVQVYYSKDLESSERIAKMFLDERLLGFDMEWKMYVTSKDGIKPNISVIQLASETKIAVFHLALFEGDTKKDLVIPSVKAILENSNVRKTGVNIMGDGQRLYRHLGIKPKSFVELSYHYNLLQARTEGRERVSRRLAALARQVKQHLGLPLSKNIDVRTSDWTKPIDGLQLDYAASDAYAGVQLYDVLEGKRKALKPCPQFPPYAELVRPLLEPDASSEDVAEVKTASGKADKGNQISEVVEEDETSAAPRPIATAVASAETWAVQMRYPAKGSGSNPCLSRASHLRAYALWHHEKMEPEEIARALRKPPLQLTTVTDYILESVRLDKLPYERERIDLVLKFKPEHIRLGKYKALCEDGVLVSPES
jgi:hypothetical protein